MDKSQPKKMENASNGESRNAILYEEDIDVRFSDLDPYGHVNSKHYIDYVLASRWLYLARKIKITIEDCLQRGLGFYMIRSEIEYKKPITKTDKIRVQSYVSKLDKIRLTVTFEIVDPETEKVLYSKGNLEFAIMDPKTNRPQACPDWGIDLFSTSS